MDTVPHSPNQSNALDASNEKRMSLAAMFGGLLVSTPAAYFMIAKPFVEIYHEKPEEFTEGMIGLGVTAIAFAAGFAVLKSIVRRSSQGL